MAVNPMQTIIDKVRAIIQDLPASGALNDQYSSSKVFTLFDKNISASSLLVYVNQTLQVSGWTFNSNTNKVTFTLSLNVDDVIEIDYTYYKKYSDNEIMGFIRSSIMWLSIEGYKTFICREDNIVFPTPDENEESLMAVICEILIDGDVWRYRTPEINIEKFKAAAKEEKIRIVIRQCMKTPALLDYFSTDVRFRENI